MTPLVMEIVMPPLWNVRWKLTGEGFRTGFESFFPPYTARVEYL